MSQQYTGKYPKIITDESTNSPNQNMYVRLTVEQYYDLLHHTHNASDIIGINNEGSVEPTDSETIQELQSTVETLTETVTTLQNAIGDISEKIDKYIEEDIGIADYDATKPGIQDENGNTIG